jgi:hypothetical protein
MATTPNMGLILDNFIGESNPTGPGIWASHLENAKGLIDAHNHGPASVMTGAQLIAQLAYVNGTSTIGVPTTATTAFTLVTVNTAAGTATIVLPTVANYLNCVIIIKDTGSAATHNITVSRGAVDLIDGSTFQVISSNYGILRLIGQAAGQWYTF